MVGLPGRLIVIGVIKARPIFEQRFSAQNGVVEHALHAVSVAAVSGDAQQISRQLEMRVCAAWSFETRMALAEAFAQVSAAGFAECLIRTPAPGCETLFLHHAESIARGAEVFLIP